MKPRKIVLGEAVEILPQTRTLRSSKRLAGPNGGAVQKALRSINKELQISSEAVTGATSEEINFNFRRLSRESRTDSTLANGEATGENVTQGTYGNQIELFYILC